VQKRDTKKSTHLGTTFAVNLVLARKS